MTKPDNRDLREVAIRALISNIVGPKWAPIADAGMTMLGNDSGEVYQKGKDFVGNVMSGYWERMGERPAKHAYERLTEKGEPTKQKPSRPVDPFFNPDEDVIRNSTNFLGRQGWRRGFYDNPEMTAEVVGATTAAAPLIVGGALLSSFAQGEKPSSAYSVPVQPSGGYNQSVESAMASAGAKYELEELKHRHNLEMQSLREQSRIPGVQDTAIGGYGGVTNNLSSANPYAGMISTAFNSPSVFPKDPGVTSMGFG